MTRAVVYARFSTELQNEKSTEDQIALCRAYAARQGFDVIVPMRTRLDPALPFLGETA